MIRFLIEWAASVALLLAAVAAFEAVRRWRARKPPALRLLAMSGAISTSRRRPIERAKR